MPRQNQSTAMQHTALHNLSSGLQQSGTLSSVTHHGLTQQRIKIIPNQSKYENKSEISSNKYEIEGVAGKGTFGVVYFGVNKSNGERIAIKKVLQDKKYKNREHQILKLLKHPNALIMLDSFLTTEGD